MKITRSILVALLTFAILASCVLLSVSAADGDKVFNSKGIEDIEDILQYYEEEYYVRNDFDAEFENGGCFLDSGNKTSVVADPKDPTNKVLFVDLPRTVNPTSVSFDKTFNEDDVVFSFSFYAKDTMNGEFKLNIRTVDADGKMSITSETFFSIDMKNHAFMYSVWDQTENSGKGAFDIVKFENAVPEANKWYKVLVFFTPSENEYSFRFTTDGETWVDSGSLSLGNVKSLSRFMLTTFKSGPKSDTVSMYLDNVMIYGGSSERFPENRNAYTARTILDLDALYNKAETDLDTKVRIVEVINKLVNLYDYQPAAGTEDLDSVEAVMGKIDTYYNNTFALKFIEMVNGIDTTKSYYPRVEWEALARYYSDALPPDADLAAAVGIGADLAASVTAARVVLETEKAACDLIKQQTESFIKAMYSYNSASKDYDGYLLGFYNTVSGYDKFDLTYKEAVAGVNGYNVISAFNDYKAFAEKFDKIYTSSKQVVDSVADMKTALAAMAELTVGEAAYETAWKNLYDAYCKAFAVLDDGVVDENLDTSTHSALVTAIEKYEAEAPAIIAEIEKCDRFNTLMNNASLATYYDAILAHLQEAGALVNVVRKLYPGVSYSSELYATLTASVSNSANAAVAYIKAVNNIPEESAGNFTQLWAAVDAARALKAAVEKSDADLSGYSDENGSVKEANIKFATAAAKVDVKINNSKAFISLVSQIENAKTLSERRNLLKQAVARELLSESEYTGVTEASEKLDAYLKAFEADVAAANNLHASSSATAADIVGAVVNNANVYKSANVVKDFIK